MKKKICVKQGSKWIQNWIIVKTQILSNLTWLVNKSSMCQKLHFWEIYAQFFFHKIRRCKDFIRSMRIKTSERQEANNIWLNGGFSALRLMLISYSLFQKGRGNELDFSPNCLHCAILAAELLSELLKRITISSKATKLI